MKPLPFTLFIACVGSFALVSISSVFLAFTSQPPPDKRISINLPIADQGAKHGSSRGSFIVNLSADGTLRLVDGECVSVEQMMSKLAAYSELVTKKGYSAYIILRADRRCSVGAVREIYDVAFAEGCRAMRFRVYHAERV